MSIGNNLLAAAQIVVNMKTWENLLILEFDLCVSMMSRRQHIESIFIYALIEDENWKKFVFR